MCDTNLDADDVVYVDADTVSWDKMSTRAPVWANNKTKFITRLMFQEKTISLSVPTALRERSTAHSHHASILRVTLDA